MSPEELDSAPNTLQTDAYHCYMSSMPVFCDGIIFLLSYYHILLSIAISCHL